ncbi:MAG: sulfatase [Roseibacillus sp.]
MKKFFVLLATTIIPLTAAQKPNVLFIAIDDLRPELGCYGSPIAQSPHLDKLASEGMLFKRAYCQQAICHPSRSSLLSGLRPESMGIVHNYIAFREGSPDVVTLPQHFAANGYETVYCGKIFHGKWTDDEKSWTRKPHHKGLAPEIKKPQKFALEENKKLQNKQFKAMFEKYGEAARRGLSSGPAYEAGDVPDHFYLDGYNTELAVATLADIVADENEKPFFLALGFSKPHLNWIAPKRYWDLYDRANIKLAKQTEAPQGGAAMGLHASFELRVRDLVPNYGPFEDQLSKTLLHSYYACVSYVDAQIGKMLTALEESGQRENTIIVVWGDHGWHLGEMGIWGKATNYEIGTRVPLLAWTPNMKARGQKSESLVELLDLYPTLCDLAGLPIPEVLEGKSFAPILDDPAVEIKEVAISQFPNPALREWAANPLSEGMRETFFGPLIRDVEARIITQQGEKWDREFFENHLMGYAVRSDRFRMILWRDIRDRNAEATFVELYDHQNDPTETVNVASQHPEVIADLTRKLNQSFTK